MEKRGVSLSSSESMDVDVFNSTLHYSTSIGFGDEDEAPKPTSNVRQFFDEMAHNESEQPEMTMERKQNHIGARENEYQKKGRMRQLSPERIDPFADKTPAPNQRTFRDAMEETIMQKEEANIMRNIKRKQEEEAKVAEEDAKKPKRRWDVAGETEAVVSSVDATPLHPSYSAGSMDETPRRSDGGGDVTKNNRWGATPVHQSVSATPMATPKGVAFGATPARSELRVSQTPREIKTARLQTEFETRNRELSDADLDSMMPTTGYYIITPPEAYLPIRTPARKVTETPTPMAGGAVPLYQIPTVVTDKTIYGVDLRDPEVSDLPTIKPEDMQHFKSLLEEVDEAELTSDQIKERRIMEMLLKIKNGTPQQRRVSLRFLTENARTYGAGPLFNQILPLMMSPTLEDQERHLLVKVIDRVLFRLDELVRPYVHKILVVIQPMLIDEDYYARVEGREIISNLAKAAGLTTMISNMRPDIDNPEEYVRNTTARAFAVVASALGIPPLLPFLKAVCQSRKSWEARHTGMKIVQQIAILMGAACLPHLNGLVGIISHGLQDENVKVKTICALAIAALAEAACPYGIEAFDDVLRPLLDGVIGVVGADGRRHSQQKSKVLAAFIKANGYVIPLMEASYASYYTRAIMPSLISQFASPDEEMKKIVLKVIKQCVATAGVEAGYVRTEILPEFFRNFWIRRMALDKRNFQHVVETTVELANKVGASDIVTRIVDDLNDESEPYRKMVMETIDKVLKNLGAAGIDLPTEEKLINGILSAFQEQQTIEDNIMLNGFGSVVTALGKRVKPYLPQIGGFVKWRLNNKAAKVRQQAADLIQRIAAVMKLCDEEKLMGHLGVVLYEYLGEEYPDVLGSILGALKAIVNVIGMTKMTPPIKDLLPRLTPILRNRHEKVQENVIDLVGRIADRGSEFVPGKEWMRISFELLDTLKAQRRAIRRAAINTFGYIAKAIGPQDVLVTLLNNLRVQERMLRVSTTIAIAIVAETCSPFTVLPALMNEYRVPELNVQNGVLKAVSFLFEYIGEIGKDYIYAVVPLLEDALSDRDIVHRQMAAYALRHVALGAVGLGLEDALIHLLNYLWPNVLEVNPIHLVSAVHEAVEGLRTALGSPIILQYLLQGLFHPARKVRNIYWRLYNAVYVTSQDAMVPYFPRFDDEPGHNYARHELDLFV